MKRSACENGVADKLPPPLRGEIDTQKMAAAGTADTPADETDQIDHYIAETQKSLLVLDAIVTGCESLDWQHDAKIGEIKADNERTRNALRVFVESLHRAKGQKKQDAAVAGAGVSPPRPRDQEGAD